MDKTSILENPIELNRNQRIDLSVLIGRLNKTMGLIKRGEEPQRHALEYIAMCRAAIAALSGYRDMDRVRDVIASYNAHSAIIMEAIDCDELTELSVINYCRGGETPAETRRRLADEVLPGLLKEVEIYDDLTPVLEPSGPDSPAVYKTGDNEHYLILAKSVNPIDTDIPKDVLDGRSLVKLPKKLADSAFQASDA